MYIEDKLFSDYSGETLYSVMLDKNEYALFSEIQQKLFGKLDRQIIAKRKNIKVSEVTDSMVKEFRRLQHQLNSEKQLGVVKVNVNQRINRRALDPNYGDFHHSASASRMREGTDYLSLGGATAEREAARARKYPNAWKFGYKSYDHGRPEFFETEGSKGVKDFIKYYRNK